MNHVKTRVHVLGVAFMMLAVASVIIVADSSDADEVLQEAPEDGWYDVTNLNTVTSVPTSGTTVTKDSLNGCGIQTIDGKYHLLIRNASNIPIVNFNGQTLMIYLEGMNNINIFASSTTETEKTFCGNISVYAAADSATVFNIKYAESAFSPNHYLFANIQKMVGGEDSSISINCSGASQGKYSVIFQMMNSSVIQNMNISYRYEEANIVEHRIKGTYSYADMCNKLLLQGSCTIKSSKIDAYGVYWGMNATDVVFEDSKIDITACDVALAVNKSMFVRNSELTLRTLWTKAWNDGNGTDGNHLPAGLSVGSPGNGLNTADVKVTIDSSSEVESMGIRFYNNRLTSETPNLQNYGTLTVNSSSFGGFDDGSYSEYGVMNSLVSNPVSSANSAAFTFVNNGAAEFNAPVYVNSQAKDGVELPPSSFDNKGKADFNAPLNVASGSSATNSGSIVYTEGASGMGNIINNGGTMIEHVEPRPPIFDDDDDYYPPYVPTTPSETDSGSDDTIKVAIVAGVAAVMICVVAMMEIRRTK